MTEDYRIRVLAVLNEMLGDPSKEVAMFCGIPTAIVVDDALDARTLWFQQKADEPFLWSDCTQSMSEFVKEVFGGSWENFAKFIVHNPKFIPYIIKITTGVSFTFFFAGIVTLIFLLVAITTQLLI